MGNSSSSTPKHQELPPIDNSNAEKDPYAWPANLYTEVKDMAEVSFLIYFFAYLVNASRQSGGKANSITLALQELEDDISNGSIVLRQFTPLQIKDIVMNNLELLTDNDDFPMDPQNMLDSLGHLLMRVPEDRPRALVMKDYDDVYQTTELVYAIGKDDINKRITLVLRGTENQLASWTNWGTNLNILKTAVELPALTRQLVHDFDTIWLHSGFYNYMKQETTNPNDESHISKYDEILGELKKFFSANPGYKLYVSGHSLGAAMATVFSFFLANEPNDAIPKPVSCINFASPRVGDGNFLKAVNALESRGYLRVCRIVNDKDTITCIPTVNFYHVGFQVKLYDKDDEESPVPEPEITYPKIVDSYWNKLTRAYSNSFVASLNFGYDHGSYRERVSKAEDYLTKHDLNQMYAEKESITGFSIKYGVAAAKDREGEQERS